MIINLKKSNMCSVRTKNQTPPSQGRPANSQRDGLLNCHPGLLVGYSTVDNLGVTVAGLYLPRLKVR